MQLKYKLALALVSYGIIAILAWQTLTETKLRSFVWLVLGFLAFKSVLFWYRTTHAQELGANGRTGAQRTEETTKKLGRE